MVEDIDIDDDDFGDIDDTEAVETIEREEDSLLPDNQKDMDSVKTESQSPCNPRRRLEQLREEKALERLLRGDYYD